MTLPASAERLSSRPLGRLSRRPEAQARMIDFAAPFDEIARDFEAEGIPLDRPGFYDHPRFKALEEVSSDYLNNYAKYVQHLDLDADYLARAERIVTAAASALAREIEVDGRERACIDASVSLSRMLDREDIWNYVVKGALTIVFPRRTKIPRLYLWPLDDPPVQAGHVWLAAPPLKIVDVTLRDQPYRDRRAASRIPPLILAKEACTTVATLEDLCSPDAILAAARSGISPDRILAIALPRLPDLHRDFPPLAVELDRVRLTYTPVGIAASDRPLERITSLRLNNRDAFQIYQDVIRPAIDEAA